MSVMGLSSELQQYALMIVAGVLHLGNIDFVERNNYAEIANKQCQSVTIALCRLYKSLTDSVKLCATEMSVYYSAWLAV